jgi:type II secretory pathway predicted ATPase ExeA
MYEAYYQLRTKPFTLLPDPEFLYLGARHKLALSLLEYGLVNGSAFIVITGEPGTGKTTLLNRLLDQSRHQWTIGVLANTHSGLGGLMPWIVASFGLQTRGKTEVELFQEFEKFLEHEQTDGRRVLLVLDEAQNMGPVMLEELRLLSNLNDGRRRSLQILLSGQPGLRNLIQAPALEQFAQRIGVDYALEPLAEDEATAYISHRIRVAGARRSLFSTLACRKIFALTGGIPRLMNQLCDYALVFGYAAQSETITARVVADVVQARGRSGLLPLKVDPASLEPTQQEREEELAELSNAPGLLMPGENAPSMGGAAERAAIDPAVTYREALALKQAGQFSQAVSRFDQLTVDVKWAVKALAQKGICLKAVGRYEDALGSFRIALARSGSVQDTVSLRYLLARTLESMGRSQEAAEAYRLLQGKEHAYRDTAERLDRLNGRHEHGNASRKPWDAWWESLQRGWAHLWHGARLQRFINLK